MYLRAAVPSTRLCLKKKQMGVPFCLKTESAANFSMLQTRSTDFLISGGQNLALPLSPDLRRF
jgi:hypothetical protein